MDMKESERLVSELKRIGIEEGDTVLVHSSFKGLGCRLENGAHSVLDALIRVLGVEGTLCLPGLSYAIVTAESPVFDVKETACNVGLIPETFRREYATHRSLHPTHSVCACGPLAEELTGGHEVDSTPCGVNSPFAKLPKVGAKLLMLGCGLRPNTSMHAIEEMAPPDYYFGSTCEYQLIDYKGEKSRKPYRVHGFEGFGQRYERIEGAMPEGSLRVGPALNGTAYLIDLAVMWRIARERLDEDPHAFVERI
ncbi:hypothetical protein VDG1235_2353 [Verrucomicrobiia bacterium DG1235]|nr:hypothetical protein VDG1235_2353 [Verrucomicrobiae bacterium DG1235]